MESERHESNTDIVQHVDRVNIRNTLSLKVSYRQGSSRACTKLAYTLSSPAKSIIVA